MNTDNREMVELVSLAIRRALGLRGQQITDLRLDARIDDAARVAIEASQLSGVVGERWQPIETAPKDGTLVLLLVDYSGEDGDHWIDDEASGLGRTIGHNNDDNVGEGEGEGWQFAGWCWTHDHYVEGVGRPVSWMPLAEPPSAALSDKTGGQS